MWFITSVLDDDISIMNENHETKVVNVNELLRLHDNGSVYGLVGTTNFDDSPHISEYLFYVFPDYCIMIKEDNDFHDYIKYNTKKILAGECNKPVSEWKTHLSTKIYGTILDNDMKASVVLSICRDDLYENWYTCTYIDDMYIDSEGYLCLTKSLGHIGDKASKIVFTDYRASYDDLFICYSLVFFRDSWYHYIAVNGYFLLFDVFTVFNGACEPIIISYKEGIIYDKH